MMNHSLLHRFPIRPWLVLLGLSVWNAACTPDTPTPTPTAIPTPQVLTVHLASDLAPLRPIISACAAEAGNAGVLVFENPVPSLPKDTQSLTLQVGYPEDFPGQAYQLGQETYVMVGNGDAAVITEEALRAMYAGEIPGQTTELWLPLEGTEGRKLLDDWMRNQVYTADAFLSPGPAEMIEVLSDEIDTIGVLPASWVDEDFRVYFSLGTANVLALTQEKAAGKLRVFLGCLQENSGIYITP